MFILLYILLITLIFIYQILFLLCVDSSPKREFIMNDLLY